MLPEPKLAIRLTKPRPPGAGRVRSPPSTWWAPSILRAGAAVSPGGKGPGPAQAQAQVSVLVRLDAWACGQTDVPRQREASLALRHPRLGTPGFCTHFGI